MPASKRFYPACHGFLGMVELQLIENSYFTFNMDFVHKGVDWK